MTSIFLNEDEYSKDGYKVIVTKEDNKMISFTVDKISPNHIGIQLDSIQIVQMEVKITSVFLIIVLVNLVTY